MWLQSALCKDFVESKIVQPAVLCHCKHLWTSQGMKKGTYFPVMLFACKTQDGGAADSSNALHIPSSKSIRIKLQKIEKHAQKGFMVELVVLLNSALELMPSLPGPKGSSSVHQCSLHRSPLSSEGERCFGRVHSKFSLGGRPLEQG